MKRAVLAMVVLTVLLSFPHLAAGADLSVGAKLGINLAWTTGDDWEDAIETVDGGNSPAIGFVGGGILEIALAEQLALQPELLFFQQKSKFVWDFGDEEAETVSTTNTFQVPLLIKGTIPAGKGRLYGVAGPALSLVLGDVESKTEIDGDEETQDLEAGNSLWLSLAVGVGYEHPVGPGYIVGDIRYTRQLTSAEVEDGFGGELEESYSNAVSYVVGFKFDL